MVFVEQVLYYDTMENFLVNKKKMELNDWLLDCAIAIGAFVFAAAQLTLSNSSFVVDDLYLQLFGIIESRPRMASYVALALITLPLVLRRLFSWPVFLVTLVMFLGTQKYLMGYGLSIIGPVIAVYTLSKERGTSEAIVASIIASASVLFASTIAIQSLNMAFLVKLQNISYLVAAALAGFAVRTHQEYVIETEQRAIAAEKSREDEAARRVEEERVRIAREVHDITAHSLSAVSIQAAAAERMIDKNPEAAKESLAIIRSVSKDSLEELRSMIGVLRGGSVETETTPTSGTERMEDIVDYLVDAGIKVDFSDREYDQSLVPRYIDVAIYGIAREAATNIVKHSQATWVLVRLRISAGKVCLRIEDNGIGRKEGHAISPHGHGIQGMRERTHLLGGFFEAEPGAKGFIVRVEIPLY